MNKRPILHRWSAFAGALALCIAAALPSAAHAQATIVIQNFDGAGEGFNDPTAVAPVGGNPGTTLGQQRLFVFQTAANIWGANLTSSVVITVRSNFDPLNCTATAAVLGSAGARFINLTAGKSMTTSVLRWNRCSRTGIAAAIAPIRNNGDKKESPLIATHSSQHSVTRHQVRHQPELERL